MSYSSGSGGSIASSSDVALSNPATAQVLTYNNSLAKWQNLAVPTPYETVTTIATAGTAQSLTVPASGKATYVLTASASSCTLTITGAAIGTPAVVTLWLKQGSSGSHSWTFPTGTIYPVGTVPTLSSVAGYSDIVTLTSVDGGTSWLLVPAATQAR